MPRVSTRLVMLQNNGPTGQFHPLTVGFDADSGMCPLCDEPLNGVSERGWVQCTDCGCVIELATGEAFLAADDEPPPGTHTGAVGEYVAPFDVPESRQPRTKG